MRRVLILLALLLPGWASALDLTTPAPEHPRLFFDAAGVDSIRARCAVAGSTHARLLAGLRTWVQGSIYPDAIGTADKTNANLESIAALWVAEADSAAADTAVKVAMWTARRGLELASTNYGHAGLSTLALAYDWCYDQFTEAQRDTVAGALARAATLSTSQPAGPWYGFYGNYRFEFAWSVYGDDTSYTYYPTGTTYTDSTVVYNGELWLDALYDHWRPCLNQVHPNGYREVYPGRRQMPLVFAAMATKYISSWDAMGEAYFLGIPAHYRARYRPDRQMMRGTSKYNTAQTEWLFRQPMWSDSLSTAMSALTLAAYNPSGSATRDDWIYLFTANPYANAATLANLAGTDLVYRDAGSAVYGRTGWTISSGSTDIMVALFGGWEENAAASVGDNHRAAGHWAISYGVDQLFGASGIYDSDTNLHYYPYITETGSHNCLLIGEQADSVVATDCHLHAWETGNDGGQMIVAPSYEQCPDCADETTGPIYTGWLEREIVGADLVWADVELSPGYADRADSVSRRWIWVRPDLLLIVDAAWGLAATDTVRALYHCIPRPVPDGTWTTVLGDSCCGGVLRSTDATTATITNGLGRARLTPIGALGASESALRLVGGTNAGGTTNAGWQQEHDASLDVTEPSTLLDSYSPGAPSYEFWLAGRNWIPGSAGTCATPTDGLYAIRNNPPSSGGKAHAAMDWRIEHEAIPSADTLVLAAAVHVGAAAGNESLLGALPDSSGVIGVVSATATDTVLVVTRPPRFAGGALEITLPGAVQSATLHVIAALDANVIYDLSVDGVVTDTLTADSTGSVSGVGASGVLALVLHEDDPVVEGACCDAAGACTDTTAAACVAAGGTYQGDGTDCDPDPCPDPDPLGECCLIDGTCLLLTEAECAGLEKSWTEGGDCDPNPCTQPTGSCCQADGTCSVKTDADCADTWTMLEDCDPNPCDQPTPDGACCYTLVRGGIACIVTTEAICDSLAGFWVGDSTTCTPDPCTGACCDVDFGDCTLTLEADCLHNWLGAGTVCDPDPCPLPDEYGACCHVDGTCTYLPASACDNWWGQDISCDPNPCPCPCWEE